VNEPQIGGFVARRICLLSLACFCFRCVHFTLPRFGELERVDRPPFLLRLYSAIYFGSWKVLLHIASLFTLHWLVAVVGGTFIYLTSMSDELPLSSQASLLNSLWLFENSVAHRMFIYFRKYWLSYCILGDRFTSSVLTFK
jgi:hypothetical protein